MFLTAPPVTNLCLWMLVVRFDLMASNLFGATRLLNPLKRLTLPPAAPMAAVLVVLALASSAAAEAAPPEPVQDSMVRLSMGRRFHGVVYRDGMVPQVQVHEKILLEGAFLDSGHIVSYLGSHGVDLDHPAVKIVLRPGAADQAPLRLVGVDERMSLAVLEHAGPFRPALPAPSEANPTQVRMAYAGESGWNILSCKILRWEPEQISPERTVLLRPREVPHEAGLWEGGFLLDHNQQVLGLVTRVSRHPLGRSLSCRLLPWSLVRQSARQVVSRNGHVRSGWLGVYVRAGGDGPQIDGIEPGSPAARAGLQSGDVVLKVAERQAPSLEGLLEAIRRREPGSQLDLVIRRGGVTREVEATLAPRPPLHSHLAWRMELPAAADGRLIEEMFLQRVLVPVPTGLGLVVDPWVPDGMVGASGPIERGLRVKSVGIESIGYRAGLRSGDILIRVNGHSVASTVDLQRSSQTGVDGFLILHYLRGGQLRTYRLRVP